MSVFFIKERKGWQYDFQLKGERHTSKLYPTKREALDAEAEKRKEVLNPTPTPTTPTDMAFIDLVNKWLDDLEERRTHRHYIECRNLARRWLRRWNGLLVSEISEGKVKAFVKDRAKVSNSTANKEVMYLRAVFNFGIREKLTLNNPAKAAPKRAGEEKHQYIPTPEDIAKVIAAADDPNIRDYLMTLRDTLARVNEINNLTWKDVDFRRRTITLYTRKKKDGSKKGRTLKMTNRLHDVLLRRHKERDKGKPWVFWHMWWDNKSGKRKAGPFNDRKKFMKTLCKKAEVPYFRFHPIRHSGASVMDDNNVPLGKISRILGHENVTTTAIYLQKIGADVETEAMEIFEDATKSPVQSPVQTVEAT